MTTFRVFLRTWTFMYRYQRNALVLAAALVLMGLYPVAVTWLSRGVVNLVVSKIEPSTSRMTAAMLLGVCYSVLTLVHAQAAAFFALQLPLIRERTSTLADELIMRKASRGESIEQFDQPHTRDQIRTAAVGGREVAPSFVGSIELFQYGVTLIGLLILLGTRYPLIALLVVASYSPLFYLQIKARSHAFAVLLDSSSEFRRLSYYVGLLLGGRAAKEIRTYGSGGFFLDKYRKTAQGIFRTTRALRGKDAIVALVWGSVGAVGIGCSYIYVIAQTTHRTFNVGDVVMFSSGVIYAGSAVRGLIQSSGMLWTTILNVHTFFSYLDGPDEEAYCEVQTTGFSSGHPAPLRSFGRNDWEIRNLSYSYPGTVQSVLRDVSLSVRSGETVAIVGENGAGKTTLIKIMLGLLQPARGTVMFRGKDIREVDILELRAKCGVAFQDPVRFNLSLYENIRVAVYGQTKDTKSVLRAAAIVGVDQIAEKTPAGFETLLGTEFAGGVDLSGGEWQKVGLARALVREPEILFLDEPSSALDPDAERALSDQIIEFAKDRTAIIISHRLSLAARADRTFVLDEGMLVEEGTHEQLMMRGGKYAHMYATQAGMYWPSDYSAGGFSESVEAAGLSENSRMA